MEKLIQRGYKFKILPTDEQKEFFLQSFGCARKIYNLYVNELYTKLESNGYENGFINTKSLKLSKYTDFKKQYDYMKDVDSQALCSAKQHFKKAISKFNKEYDKKNIYKKKQKKRRDIRNQAYI